MPNTEYTLPRIHEELKAVEQQLDLYFGQPEKQRELFLVLSDIRDFFIAQFSNLVVEGSNVANELLASFLYFKQVMVAALTKLEDIFYRGGVPKSPLRATMFNVAAEVGTAKVPGEVDDSGQWKVLDYRKIDSADKDGEVLEALSAYKDYLDFKTDESALDLILELSDTMYNLIQGVDGVEILRTLDGFDPSGRMGTFGVFLIEVATLKFHQRYVVNAGTKAAEAEKLRLLEQLKQLNIEPQFLMANYGDLVPTMLQKITEMSVAFVEAQSRQFFEKEEDLSVFLAQTLISAETLFASR